MAKEACIKFETFVFFAIYRYYTRKPKSTGQKNSYFCLHYFVGFFPDIIESEKNFTFDCL